MGASDGHFWRPGNRCQDPENKNNPHAAVLRRFYPVCGYFHLNPFRAFLGRVGASGGHFWRPGKPAPVSVKQKQPTHGRFKAFLSRVWVFLRLNPFRGFLGRVGALQLFESVALLLRQVFFVTTAKTGICNAPDRRLHIKPLCTVNKGIISVISHGCIIRHDDKFRLSLPGSGP